MHRSASQVTTPGSTLILANGQATIDSPSIALNGDHVTLNAPITMLGSETTNIMTNMRTGVTLTATSDVEIEATAAATIMADRGVHMSARSINSRTTGAATIQASSLAIDATTVTASGSDVTVTAGNSKMGIAAATAMINSGSITLKATNAFSVTAATVTVGSTGQSVVVDSTGASVTSNSKITFTTAKRTITLDDLMTVG